MLRPAAIPVGALILFLAGSPTSARAAETGGAQVPAITLTLADSGTVVDLRVGDHVVLRLEENPTTGYRWAVEAHDADLVALKHAKFTRSPEAATGGGGQRTWTFIAKRRGTATLQLKLWRAWEGDASVTRRFTATLRVLNE